MRKKTRRSAPLRGLQTHEHRLLPAQSAVVADTSSPLIVFVGGYGSGKTHAWICKMLQLIQANPGIPGMVVMPTYGMLADVAVPDTAAALDEFGVEYRVSKPQGRTNFEINLGGEWSTVRFRSAETPRRLEGQTIGWCLVDEAGQCSDAAIRVSRARVRHPRSRQRQVGLFGTPELQCGAFYDEAEAHKNLTTRVVRADTRENKFNPSDYVTTQFAGFTEPELDKYMRGLFVPPRGRVYGNFDAATHLRRCDNPEVGEHWMFCDFNVQMMVWLLARKIHDEIHVFGEIVRGETSTIHHTPLALEVWCDLLNTGGTKLTPTQVGRYVTCAVDASGASRATSAPRSDVEHLRAAGFTVRHKPANPSVRDRVYGVNLGFAENRIFIDPVGAPTLVRSIQQQGFDQWGSPDKRHGLDHACDALGYGVYAIHRVLRPGGNKRRATVGYT